MGEQIAHFFITDTAGKAASCCTAINFLAVLKHNQNSVKNQGKFYISTGWKTGCEWYTEQNGNRR